MCKWVNCYRLAADEPLSVPMNMIHYQYSDIITATNNFDSDHLIGQGGFGDVYRGNIRSTSLAIKRLSKVPMAFAHCLLNNLLRDCVKEFVMKMNDELWYCNCINQ